MTSGTSKCIHHKRKALEEQERMESKLVTCIGHLINGPLKFLLVERGINQTFRMLMAIRYALAVYILLIGMVQGMKNDRVLLGVGGANGIPLGNADL